MILLTLGATACGGAESGGDPNIVAPRIIPPDDVSDIDEAEVPGAVAIAPTLVEVKTYDGSGELVHPDVAFFPRAWQGHRYWLSATPYPGGDSKFENPSIFTASSGREMLLPTGATNPLALPASQAYLSDPDLVVDPVAGELRMYYRQTLPTVDQLFVSTSRNGVEWTKGRVVVSNTRWSLISPAIVRESAGSWRMWTVNAVVAGCQSAPSQVELEQRQSTDGETWSDPQPVLLTMPGRVPWHWDVQYVAAKREYWALIAAYPQGSNCARTSIYFARSADGTTWEVSPEPLLAAGTFLPLRDLVYRSTFHYHEGSDAVAVWFSGARLDGNVFHYAVATARYPLAELLRRVNGDGPPAMMDRGQAPRSSPELEAARARFVRDFP